MTTQFVVGRNKTARVVIKQFPLHPAAAKTIHRSQGDTETRIVVDFGTRKTIPHIHYVRPSRVTAREGLYISDLCDSKIVVNPDVKKETERLRTTAKLRLCMPPLYDMTPSLLKLCYLNARSLHRHTEDIRKDLNYSSAKINIFVETRFSSQDIMKTCTTLLVLLSSETITIIPAMDQGLISVQLCTIKSHTYLDTPIVTIYMVLKKQ